MLSAVPAAAATVTIWASSWRLFAHEFCGEVIAVSPEDPVFGRGRGGVVRAGAAPGRGICALLTTNGGPTTPSPTLGEFKAAPLRSLPPANAPTRPANAPPKRYSASTPPDNRSRSHTSPAQQACLGPGSTASPICEPTSTDSTELPQLRLSPFHHLNEDQPNRCDNASRLPALDEITRLKADNHQLQEHLAQHLGHRRHNRIPAPSATCLPHETQAPNHHSVQPSR